MLASLHCITNSHPCLVPQAALAQLQAYLSESGNVSEADAAALQQLSALVEPRGRDGSSGAATGSVSSTLAPGGGDSMAAWSAGRREGAALVTDPDSAMTSVEATGGGAVSSASSSSGGTTAEVPDVPPADLSRLPPEVAERCAGTVGDWCGQYLMQVPIPTKVMLCMLRWRKAPAVCRSQYAEGAGCSAITDNDSLMHAGSASWDEGLPARLQWRRRMPSGLWILPVPGRQVQRYLHREWV
jgi:hypothetical protein